MFCDIIDLLQGERNFEFSVTCEREEMALN